MSAADYAAYIEHIWHRRLGFTDLLSYAERLGGSPALVATLYRTWLARNEGPLNCVAWFNLGSVLDNDRDAGAAEEAFRKAIELNPKLYHAHINLGLVLERKGQPEQAIAQWRVVEEGADPTNVEQRDLLTMALNHIGRLLENRRQYQPASAALEKSLCINPNQEDAIHHLIFERQKQCAWPIYAPVGTLDAEALRACTSALAMLNVSDDPAEQLEIARRYIERKLPKLPPRLAPNRYHHEKIRIAYASGDFCTHPVAMLTVQLFELHDRSQFDVYAICWSPNDGGTLRQRIIDAADHYLPVHDKSEDEIARLIRENEIDILVDLQGQTSGAKIHMIAQQPAPIQITYLGLPATTAQPGIEYVIADRYIIPKKYAKDYSEKPIYMPDVYQVSDQKRVPGKTLTRKEYGLPARKTVLCSLNNNHKITPEVFDVWMNILRRVPNSVLWLLADNEWAKENLIKEAKARGIPAKQLVFAERSGQGDYLARYAVADLFLDTFPFNAGTTANDALWMGLPVLTMSGRAFASRMAGALLTAAGLPELITHDLQGYEELAVQLASDKKALKALRQKLLDAKENSPLFDSEKFTRNLEKQYVKLVEALPEAVPEPLPEASPEAIREPQPEASHASDVVVPITRHTKKVPEKKVSKVTAVVMEAEGHQVRGDINAAIATYRRWLRRTHNNSPSDWIVQFNMGVLLRDVGDTKAAKEAMLAALRQKPDFALARKALEQMTTH
ncbi:Conserved hypothetical protein [gamma proteobacterium HdN1]|nr:Conserved hypothetical protein [gamma proteobacterium HdN1]